MCFKYCMYIFILCMYCVSIVNSTIDPDAFIIWGPGLKSDFNVPVRYFFIQAVDTNGNNATSSLGDKFSVILTDSHRVYFTLLDRDDGSYIARFRLHTKRTELKFAISYDGEPIARSPVVIAGTMYYEKCRCPEISMKKYMKSLNCPPYRHNENLERFRKSGVDMITMRDSFYKRFDKPYAQSLTHYVIKDNKIYLKKHGEHVGFHIFTDAILLSISKKVVIPDMEVFWNLGDWPLILHKDKEEVLPLFSWCGSDDSHDIILPTYDLTESVLEMLNRVSLDMFSVTASKLPRWQDKNDTAFWRGRDSTQERLDLIKLAMAHPEIIDARLTNMFFFKHDVKEHGELVKHVPFTDFFKYKYQINMDGTVAAYRLPYLLGGNSLILKQESPYWEHFYKDLIPFKHYVPVKRDISDLLEKIKWAKEHEKEVKLIISNAQQYVREYLNPSNIICSHLHIFSEYASMLTSPVEVLKDMELVEGEDNYDAECKCDEALDKEEL